MNKIQIDINTELVVVGDIHAHESQFLEILEIIKPSPRRLLISVGDIHDKGQGREAEDRITRKLIDLHQQGKAFAVKGNHELKIIRKNRGKLSPELQWWNNRPLSLTFEYPNGTLYTILHAGVLPSYTWNSLNSDLSLCYVRDVDDFGKMIKLKWIDKDGKPTLVPEKAGGTSWHHLYNGRFGYILSGHQAQKDGVAKFYNYSCNLDSAVYSTGVLTAKLVNSFGLGELFTVSGKAYGKDIET